MPTRIVLVDDDPDDRALVRRELSRELPLVEIVEVARPDELEAVLAGTPFDVIITDYHLNWADGFDVFERFRERWPGCPVIMYTGTGSEEVAVEAMKRGLDDYIVKSQWHLKRLVAVVRGISERKRSQRALEVAERDRQQKVEELQALTAELERSNARLREAVAVAEEARAIAESANRAKSQFLATMSHELRTPLNAIVGYLEVLDIGISGPLTDAQRSNLARIRTSSEHLVSLIDDILDIARIESSRIAMHSQLSPAADVVDAAVALVRPRAEAQGLTLTVETSDPTIPFFGDADRVRQILSNLLGNAVKFTPAGGTVSIGYGIQQIMDGPRPRRLTYFQVHDTGIGIDSEQLGRIFDPFVQLEAGHTRTRGGAGLGLAISRRLARIMHGDIEVTSARGEGSTFTLHLPSAAADIAEQHTRDDAAIPADLDTSRMRGLAELSRSLLGTLDEVASEFVRRIRLELHPPGESLDFTVVLDHQATLIADIMLTLAVLDESSGEPSRLLSDGNEIQRTIIQLHALQRIDLGWPASLVQQEYELLRSVLRSAIQRLPLVDAELREQAGMIVDRMLEQAAHLSARAHPSA